MIPDIDTKALILIVEDDENSRDLLDQVLTDAGYSVVAAVNGEDAIKMVTRHAPDLVVTDLAMPNLDGIELCKRLRSAPATQKLPVIFLSASETLRTQLDAFDAGANDFVQKPLDEDVFLPKVERLIDLHRSMRRMQSFATHPPSPRSRR